MFLYSWVYVFPIMVALCSIALCTNFEIPESPVRQTRYMI